MVLSAFICVYLRLIRNRSAFICVYLRLIKNRSAFICVYLRLKIPDLSLNFHFGIAEINE